MARFFGTDGIRGLANQDPVSPEAGLCLGRALVRLLEEKGLPSLIVVGRDTRVSGKMLEYALLSGVLSGGGYARRAGVLPTPGVAYLARKLGAGAGVMVSASHNPYEYNGFKVFSHEGFKLPDHEEIRVEELMALENKSLFLEGTREPGMSEDLQSGVEWYADFLAQCLPAEWDLNDIRIALDCAHGATYKVAPLLLERLGAEVKALFVSPDGRNINHGCGSQHTEALSHYVTEAGADVGLAFDGDGDRLIAVDEKGGILTGDQVLTILAKMMKEKGALKNNLVVSTVMSNIGLSLALKDLGIAHAASKVGDRHVLAEMVARDASLGGEESGHVIFRDLHTTGDGILSGLQLLLAMKTFDRPLSLLSQFMTVFPQALVNVRIKAKKELGSLPKVNRCIEQVEQELGSKGRVVVRFSGTEPVCRVMVEGDDEGAVWGYANRIAKVVEEELQY